MSITRYDPYPDTVIHNGQILTVDGSFSVARALAVKGDRVVLVGSEDEALAAAGSTTRVIDLGGRTVVPGFIDTHAHMDREGLRTAYPDLQKCRSIADVQQVVRQAVSGREPGEWAVILPLGEPPFHLEQAESLAERRYPNRHDLDRAAPDNPVWIRSIWALWSGKPPFVHVLNSAGLKACGITRDTPAPTSIVEIEKDEAGEPTGRILEWHTMPAAEFTVLKAAPRFTREVRMKALKEAMRLSLAAGTTSVYEGHGVGPEVHGLYKELHERGEQLVRAYLAISLPPWKSTADLEQMLAAWAHYASGPGFGDDWLKVGGIFLVYGGHPQVAAACRSAWPYTGWAGFTDQCNSLDEYRELCRLAAKHRLRVNSTIGKGLGEILQVWEEVDREYPIGDLRWVVVHARIVEPERDYPRLKKLGCVVTTHPATPIYRSGLAMVREGADENKLLPHRDFHEEGIPCSLATDGKPFEQIFNLWLATARRERVENRILGPKQKLTVPQALRALTYGGAQVCFEEREKGSLEVGKLADLLVLSEDPLRVEEDALKEIRVELTMVAGRVVHSNGAVAEPDPGWPQRAHHPVPHDRPLVGTPGRPPVAVPSDRGEIEDLAAGSIAEEAR